MDFRDTPAAIRTGEELDLVRLEAFLRQHFPGHGNQFEVRQFPSGHSNLTYWVRLGDREMVLRRPPFGSKVKSAHDMGREFRVLSKLHQVYAPAPEVQLYCDDATVLGSPFYVMEPIHGVILRRDPPAGLAFEPATVSGVCESFVENLARLHSIDFKAIGLGDFGKPVGYMERQVNGWIERYYGSKTQEFAEVERLAEWMRENLSESGDATLIHNDYKLDNLVLDAGDLTKIIGVLDWEMSTIGDPLSDLGTALAYWVDADDLDELQEIRWGPTNYAGSMKRSEIAERYARKTRRDLENLVFYLVFARFKLAVIVHQIYYRYHLGLTKDARFAEMRKLVEILLRAAWQGAQSNSI